MFLLVFFFLLSVSCFSFIVFSSDDFVVIFVNFVVDFALILSFPEI